MRMLLDMLFSRVAADQQLMEPDSAFITRSATGIAAHGGIKRKLSLVVREHLDPLPIDRLIRCLGVTLPILGIAQFGAVLFQNQLEFFLSRDMRRLALRAQTFRQTLRENSKQSICEIEWVHAHVEESDDGLRRAVGVQGCEYQMA